MTFFFSTFFAVTLLHLPGQNYLQTFIIKAGPAPRPPLEFEIAINDLPQKIEAPKPEPEISAAAAIILDVDSAVILLQKNPDDRLMPASTTKIMTALIALEEYDLSDTIQIKNEHLAIGNTSDLVAGEQLTIADAIKALLIGSGNDVALALGQHHREGYAYFVSLMNQKAAKLHLKNSNFTNVSGVEQSNHYTSARDLALLAKYAMQNDFFRTTVGTRQTTISAVDGNLTHNLKNTNQLLGVVEGVTGIKTGWTPLAGECLVTSLTRNNRRLIIVVLGSNDRFGETETLANWAYQNHTWIPFPHTIIQPLPVPN